MALRPVTHALAHISKGPKGHHLEWPATAVLGATDQRSASGSSSGLTCQSRQGAGRRSRHFPVSALSHPLRCACTETRTRGLRRRHRWPHRDSPLQAPTELRGHGPVARVRGWQPLPSSWSIQPNRRSVRAGLERLENKAQSVGAGRQAATHAWDEPPSNAAPAYIVGRISWQSVISTDAFFSTFEAI
jgi:hypothetical protein